jgi:hypothetical protein
VASIKKKTYLRALAASGGKAARWHFDWLMRGGLYAEDIYVSIWSNRRFYRSYCWF